MSFLNIGNKYIIELEDNIGYYCNISNSINITFKYVH